MPVELRIYDNLFCHSDPENKELVPNGWLSDINPNSLVVKKGFADIGGRLFDCRVLIHRLQSRTSSPRKSFSLCGLDTFAVIKTPNRTTWCLTRRLLSRRIALRIRFKGGIEIFESTLSPCVVRRSSHPHAYVPRNCRLYKLPG